MTRSLSLEALEDRTTPTAYGVPAHSATAYVQTVYHDVLGRDPSAPELNYWAHVAGAFGTNAAASGILNSTENQNRMVNDLYVKLLARNADDAGIRYWRGVLSGSGLERVTAGILASPEFQSMHVDTHVGAEFQQMLGRAPNAHELSYWTAVESGQGEGALAAGIIASAEYRAGFTQMLFALDLHRQGNSSELSYFANSHTMNLLQIEAMVLTSPEYVGNAGAN
jgi:hypothetical protein